MSGARKFHNPDGPAFNAGGRWKGSDNYEVEIVATKRYGPLKWDVDVCYRQSDGQMWMKDAWSFQVRYRHIADVPQQRRNKL